jgi:hypothetical protein
LVATPDCKPTVLGSNPADSPAYSGPPVLRWAAIWDGNFTVGCPLRAAEENINKTKKGLLVHQKTKRKKKNNGLDVVSLFNAGVLEIGHATSPLEILGQLWKTTWNSQDLALKRQKYEPKIEQLHHFAGPTITISLSNSIQTLSPTAG